MRKSCSKSVCISRPKALYLALLACCPGLAWGLPQDGQVTAGQADIHVTDNTMDVEQSTDRVILEFESFDVEAGETVNFHQPGRDSVALNRVVGNNLSQIDGAINANGQVFLINTNGVLFGNQARVHVGGLTVSTLDMVDRDFLLGRHQVAGDSQQAIVNNGHIQGQDDVVLVGAQVRNNGVIESGGSVQMAATQAALIGLPGSDIPLLIEDGEGSGLVDNQGHIHAERVALVSQNAIENDGLIRAVQADDRGGSVVLSAAGDAVIGGAVDVSGEAGGQVQVEANRYAQTGQIDARGAAGGGEVTVRTEQTLVQHGGSEITADAQVAGDGGDIILISERDTWFRNGAQLSARGGAEAGDGGFVEVSGHQFVDVQGRVDVGAPQGEAGLWYIDPTDITINSNGVNDGSFVGPDPFTWDLGATPPNTAQIHIDTITNTLRNDGNVLISTQSTATGPAGDITFAAGFDYDGFTQLNTLSLVADGDIVFSPGVAITDANPGVEGVNFNLTAAGNISMDSSVSMSLGTGGLTANAGGNVGLATVTGDHLNITASGTVSALAAGLAMTDTITLNANDLLQNGTRALTVDAPNINIDTAAAGGDLDITTAATNLSIANRGGNAVNIYDVDALNLTGIQPQSGLIRIYSGAGSLLSIVNDIDLDGMSGNIRIESDAGVDVQGSLADLTGPVDHNVGIYLEALTDLTFAPGAVVDSGSAGVTLYSEGANLQLGEARGASVTVVAAGSITDVNGDAVNIISPVHTLAAGAGVGSAGDAIDTNGGSLSLDSGGLTVTEAGDVYYRALNTTTLADSEVDGNLNLVVDSGDLILAEQTLAHSGALSASAASGRLRVNDLGLTAANGLTVIASNLESLSGAAAQITAPQADITVTSTDSGDVAIGGDFDTLNLTVQGTRNVSLSDTDDLQVDLFNSAGSVALSSGGNLAILDAAAVWGNSLDLTAVGDLQLPATPVDVTDSLSLSAVNVSDGDNTLAVRAGGQLSFNLTPTVAHTFNSEVTSVSGQINNAQLLTINELDDLEISSLQSGGNVVIAAGGGLQLSNTAYDITGSTQLSTAATSSIQLEDGGVGFSGDLSLDTGWLQDSDNTVSVTATQADISLRSNTAGQVLNSQFDTLVLQSSGGGAVALTDSNGLTLQSLSADGGADIAATAADLVVASEPTVAGTLRLATNTSGAVVIPDSGLNHSGTLQVAADTLSDSDSSVTLQGDSAELNLRNSAAALTLDTQLNQLLVALVGGGDLTVTEVDGLAVNGLQADANVAISTGADLILVDSVFDVTGLTQLTTPATNQVVVSDSGASFNGDLSIDSGAIQDSDSVVSLAAGQANLTLRDVTVAQTINSQFDGLTLVTLGGSGITVTDADGLTLGGLNSDGQVTVQTTAADLVVGGAADALGGLSLATLTSGDLVVPDAGLSVTDTLEITADALRDSDNQVALQAGQASLNLRASNTALTLDTQLDQLAIVLTGGGALSVNDSDGLTVSALQAGGPVSLRTNAADLDLLPGSVNVGGPLLLQTVSSGDVTIADTGLTVSDALVVEADNLRDSDTSTQIQADSLDLTLRDGTTAHNLQTQIATLTADYAGTGALTLANTGPLSVTGLSSGGNVALTSSADLDLTQLVSSVAGDWSLNAGGDLLIADAGLQHSGLLQISANDLVSASATTPVVQATELDLNLLATNRAQTLTTNVGRLSVSYAGSAPLQLTNTGDLSLASITSSGDANITTSGDLRVEQVNTAVRGAFSLAAGDQLVLSDAGIQHTGTLNLNGYNLVAATGGPVLVQASTANIDLRGAQDLALHTQVDQLSYRSAGLGGLAIDNDRALQLVAFDAPLVTGLDLVVNGDLVIPASGLNLVNGPLSIAAQDMNDGDRNVTLGGVDLTVNLSQVSADSTWSINTDRVDIHLGGSGGLTLNSGAGLQVTDLDSDGQALQIDDGNLVMNISDGDLLVDGIVSVRDGADDGVLRGAVELNLTAGSVLLGQSTATLVESDQSVETTATPVEGEYALTINIADLSAAERGIAVGGDASAEIRSIGGDIEMIVRRAGTPEDAERYLDYAAGSEIRAYNDLGDPLTGRVLLNGSPITPDPAHRIGSGRTLAIMADDLAVDYDDVFGDHNDVDTDNTTQPPEPTVAEPTADAQFVAVFGSCDELDPNNQQRCRVERALKAFLSHWLVGGEMPPRTEIK